MERPAQTPEDPTADGYYCGAKVRHRQGHCRKPAGWGTDHNGQGRCKLHGGSVPIKHGLYSRIKRKSLQEKLDAWRQVKANELTDLSEEILVAKAMVESHLEAMPTDDQGMVVLTQRGMADLAGFLGVWLERVAKLTETADRIKRGNRLVISTETVDRLLEAVTQILMTYVPEDKQEEALNALRDASR